MESADPHSGTGSQQPNDGPSGGIGIGLRPSDRKRRLSFSDSMQKMRVAVNVHNLNNMVTSPLHISKERLQRLGSKALFKRDSAKGMHLSFDKVKLLFIFKINLELINK